MRMKHKVVIGNQFDGAGASLLAILCAMLFGFLIMLAFNPESAWPAFVKLLQGGAASGRKGIGQAIYYTAPYIMLGLATAFSFQTGIFNMGVTGQFTIGAITAILVGGLGGAIPASIRWIVALLAAGLAGMLWSIVPGVLKACFGTNEVISCIMMNYTAMYVTNELIVNLYYDGTLVSTKYVLSDSLLPRAGLDTLFPKSNANSGIIFALLFVVLIYIILFKTSFGFGLRASGKNLQASRYAGVSEKRNIISVFLIGGVLAGIGGGILHLSAVTKVLDMREVFIPESVYALPIALLANNHPIGVIFTSLLMAWMTVGSTMIQANGFPTETVTMLTAVIFYFSALAFVFRKLIEQIRMKRTLNAKNGGTH